MTHLVRFGVLIVALAIFFFLVRGQFVPTSFGAEGFFRTDNISEWMSWQPKYAEPQTCSACHKDNYSKWVAAKHNKVSCETCHGPAGLHAQGKGEVVVNRSKELCATCHAVNIARPASFPQVDVEAHSSGLDCTACHNPHSPSLSKSPVLSLEGPVEVSKTGQTPAVVAPPNIPHSIEGRSDCLACHSAKGIKPFPQNHEGRTSEICMACHKPKQESGS